MGLFYLFKTCIMAVRKIFTGSDDSTTGDYELCVYEAEGSILIEIDSKDLPPAYINLDLDTLNELIIELKRIEILIMKQ
jgi:hypothetical protein